GGSATTNGVFDKLTRIAATCVFFEPYKSSVQDLSGADIVKSGDAGTEGDYIKFNNNTILTGGLQDAGKTVVVDSVKTASNGKVYFINDLLTYSEKPVGTHVKNLGTATTSQFNYFWQYLSNSAAMFNATTTDINGLTGFSTVFVPNNAAILQAVNDGILPGTGTAPNKVPTFNPANDVGREQVRRFLQYHILFSRTVVPDGNASGSFDTYLKNAVGANLKISISNSRGAMHILDAYDRQANVIMAQSNNLSNRCVIHLLDGYLKYN
ncbi:MAG TPA: fasciclin domain-containing protein, partial [Niastella sp.]